MKYKLFVLTVLASVGFFNFHAILSPSMQKAIFYLFTMACVVMAVMYGEPTKHLKYPRIPYIVLLATITFSIVMASAFHTQSLFDSIVTTFPYIISYGFLWVMLRLDIPREKIMNAYLWLCAASTVVYFCNALTVPFNIFGERIIDMDMTRGIVRLPVVFIEIFPLLVFYSIGKWMETHEKKWLFILAWLTIMIFLSVVRQIIAVTAVLALWYYFRKISVWKKLLLIVAALAIVVFVLPQIPMYKTMIELSEDQADENVDEENIRIQAWRYYTYEHQTNALTPIFGNGIPASEKSPWGMQFWSETDVSRCFTVDVGWAGFFWYFGIIATGCLLYILLQAYFKNKPENKKYLNYWLAFLMITAVASGPILYYWQIFSLSIVLSMVYLEDKDEEPDSEASSDSEDVSTTRAYNQYPQL